MPDSKTVRRLYDGALMCHSSNCCPVADLLDDGTVRMHDPEKPESGSFTMTQEEYNLFAANAKLIG